MLENPENLIEVKNVNLEIQKKEILNNISMTVHRQEIVCLVGPNGAGKSSLLKVVLGLLSPSNGKVIRKKGLKIGYMPQKLELNNLLPLSVKDFLKLSPAANQQKITAICQEVNINEILESAMHVISGGEMQRVLLARAMLNTPDLLVLDEPAQGVDILGQANLYKLILGIKNKINCGILLVSHDLHLVIEGTDQVICLNKHICCSGEPDTVTNHPEYRQLFYRHEHDHEHDI